MFGVPEDAHGTLLVLTLNWLANAAACWASPSRASSTR
jgi:hypothetical protein